MAKHKGRKAEQKHGNTAKAHTHAARVQKPPHSQSQKHRKNNSTKAGQPQKQHSIQPYGERDRILLVGEGDFSFARSLVKHHGCTVVTATCFDSQVELEAKYRQAKHNVVYLQDRAQTVLYGVDATKLNQKLIRRPPPPIAPLAATSTTYADARSDNRERRVDEADSEGGSWTDDLIASAPSQENDMSDEEGSFEGLSDDEAASLTTQSKQRHTVIAGPRGWDIVSFNFPHVGGKSTDVNRQVRYNQALLVDFFKAATPLLTPPCGAHRVGGVILVTLFEGEPYTLWNIKDLARHAGLRNERSWRFDAAMYPGYSHARTLGSIEGGGGWKGEDRAARTYAFVAKDAPSDVGLFDTPAPGSRKRKKEEDSDDDGDDGVD